MSLPRNITHEQDPRIPQGLQLRTLKSGKISYKHWFLPITYGHLTLREAIQFLNIVAAPQAKIPEVIRWTEGKDSHLAKQFFYGGVDLLPHDCIHILLGRGLLGNDEAFVIGFTMGSTKRLETMNKEVFAYIAQHYYPNAYRMNDHSRVIYRDATKLGHISNCQPLDEVDFEPMFDWTIDEVRKTVGIETAMIQAYYRDIEQRRLPEDPSSSRLLPTLPNHNPWTFNDDDSGATLANAAHRAEARLNESDQIYQLDAGKLSDSLKLSISQIEGVLHRQRDITRMCFEEIKNVCGENHPHVKHDIETHHWEAFFESAHQDVITAQETARCDMTRRLWEQPGPAVERRSYVHALLARGNSPVDRAFCRGFYDGSTNRRTSYATEMKLDALGQVHFTLDGHYTKKMCRAYRDGVRLGFVSDCKPLVDVEFERFNDDPLAIAREKLNLTTSLLTAYQAEVKLD